MYKSGTYKKICSITWKSTLYLGRAYFWHEEVPKKGGLLKNHSGYFFIYHYNLKREGKITWPPKRKKLGFFSEWIDLSAPKRWKEKVKRKRKIDVISVCFYNVYTIQEKKCALGITKDNVLEFFYHRRPSTGLSSYGFAEMKKKVWLGCAIGLLKWIRDSFKR